MLARHATAIFFALSYFWAWALWGYWIPAMPPGGLVITPAFLASALAGGLGPSVAAIAVTAATGGWKGVGDLLGGVLRWRADVRWYAIALLLVPAITTLSLIIQMPILGPPVWGDLAMLAPLAVAWPIMAALGEEFGWRGFALPRLAGRFGVLAASLIVGLAWGLWHLPADYIALKAYGWWFVPAFVASGPLLLTAHAVIMGWLWARTARNLLLMLVYHFSITSSAIIAPTVTTSPAAAVAAAFISAALFWAVALWLIVFRRGDFSAGRSS